MESRELRLACESGGERIDAWLSEHVAGVSRSYAQKLLAGGAVSVNGAPAPKSYRTKRGDSISLSIPPPESPVAKGQDIPIAVVYEDAHIIVVDKPQGMVVHPAAGNADGTLVNALLFHCAGRLSDISGVVRPGIVHRLDKDTSGLIVAAKTNAAHQKLAADFKERRVRKLYNAIAVGHLEHGSGRIELPIGRHRTDRKKMAVLESGGRPAVTLFRVVRLLDGLCTWLEAEILTGRTHQIRVHLSHIGHPVLGDALYGGAPRQRQPASGAGWRASGAAAPMGAAAVPARAVGDPEISAATPSNGGGKCARDFAVPVRAAVDPACGAAAPAGCAGRPESCLPAQPASYLHATLLSFEHPITGAAMAFESPLPERFVKLINSRSAQGI
jgi:23S rRNA pseudouridine1911/1915/1917 synthase